MDLSIVVVSWNTRDLLRSCLQSIRETAAELDHEVIVVDNASSDGSAEMVSREFPDALLIVNTRNVGFAGANNQAIVVGKGDFVLLLNSDAVLLPGAALELVRYLRRRPEAAVAGAQLLNPDRSFQWSYADFPSFGGELLLATKLAGFVRPAYPSYPESSSQAERSVDWVSGACMMVRRSAIRQVGLLDDGYFMYTEETDWCYRMRQSGWSVGYVPQARVLHWGGQSASAAPERKRSQVYRSKWRFFQKHRGRLTAAAFRGAIQAASAAKLLAWSAASLIPRRPQRDNARRQVRSYVRLMAEMW
jgi:N-acetylglucosaminyl-diphospho-decaprenol L-rhamnosyltransferase